MNKTIAISLVCAALDGLILANTLVYESFEQAAPGALNGQNGTGSGFAGPYADIGYGTVVLDPASRMVYQNGELNVDGGSTYLKVQATKAQDIVAWGREITPLTAPEGNGPFYMSVLFRVSNSVAQAADEDSILFGITTVPTTYPYFGINLAKHSSGTGNAIGIRSGNNNKVNNCPAIEGGVTYLVVFKWYMSNNFYRMLSMVVNPTTTAEPAEWTVTQDGGFQKSLSEFLGVSMYMRKSCETEDVFEIDEFRIGTSWADVTGAATHNGVVPRPAVTVAGSGSSRTVTIASAVDGGSCYYTTDGSEPSAQNGTLYTAPFTLTDSADVKAVAVDAGGNTSAVVLALVNFEAHWVGAGADDNWLTSGNWLPAGSPANKSLVFGAEDRTAVGTVNNVIDQNITVRSICFTNNNFAPAVATANCYSHVGTIAEGRKLKVVSMDDDGYSLLMTSPRGKWDKNSKIQASFGGGGAFEIDSPYSKVFLSCSSSSAYTTTLLDLSGLGVVDMDVSKIYVGHFSRTRSYLNLSRGGRNTLTADVITVGDSHDTSEASASASEIVLGQTNVINANLLCLASSEQGFFNINSGKMYFYANGLSNPTLKIRARDGAGRAEVRVGGHGQGGDVGMKSTVIEGTLDLSGGTVDALIDELHVTRACGRRYDGSNNGGQANGIIRMESGLMDVNKLFLVYSVYHSKSDPSCLWATGELDVSGGEFRVNEDADVADNNAAGSQSVSAEINQTGGTISIGGDLALASRHGYATNVTAHVNVSAGELSVAGNLVGGTDDEQYKVNFPAELVGVQANVNALGGVITVTNALGTSELRLEKGTLTLAGGKVFADNLVLTNAASAMSLEIDADYKPVSVTAGGAIKLGGTLRVAPKDGARLSGPYVIASGGARVGRFSAVDLPEGYRVYYGADSVSIGGGATIIMVR